MRNCFLGEVNDKMPPDPETFLGENANFTLTTRHKKQLGNGLNRCYYLNMLNNKSNLIKHVGGTKINEKREGAWKKEKRRKLDLGMHENRRLVLR